MRARTLAQVLYVREGVAVWPCRRRRILGRLSIVEQHSVLFLAWLPYSSAAPGSGGAAAAVTAAAEDSDAAAGSSPAAAGGDDDAYGSDGALSSDDDAGARGAASSRAAAAAWHDACTQQQLPPLQQAADGGRSLYAIRPLPLSDVAALNASPRRLGRPASLTLVLRSGVTLPPLVFSGGLRALLRLLHGMGRLLAPPGGGPGGSWVVNDVADPLPAALAPAELDDIL